MRTTFRVFRRARGGVVGAPAKAGTPQAQRLIPKIDLGPVGDRIFGGRYVDIRPAGSVTIKAGARFNVNENPALTLRQQRTGDFIFDQSMNVNLTGQVGTKLKLAFNYDTKASFDFDNQMKFDYAGQETDILRKLDLGNVSLPLGVGKQRRVSGADHHALRIVKLAIGGEARQLNRHMRLLDIDNDEAVFPGGDVGVSAGDVDATCIRQRHGRGPHQCGLLGRGDINDLHAVCGGDE